jgi:hypothetical protein
LLRVFEGLRAILPYRMGYNATKGGIGEGGAMPGKGRKGRERHERLAAKRRKRRKQQTVEAYSFARSWTCGECPGESAVHAQHVHFLHTVRVRSDY